MGKPNQTENELSCRPWMKYVVWALLIAIVLSAAAIRIRLLNTPLERDEGEFAYMGQLMLHGVPPYVQAYNMKLPGTYAAYALIMAIFGQTVTGIHIGFMLVNVATILLIFLLGRRVYDPTAGIVAAASYALLSVSKFVLGTSAHATHFVVLPALGGSLLLLKGIASGRKTTLFWSGLLFGLAFLMKQHGMYYGVFAGLYLAWAMLRERPIAWQRIVVREAALVLGGLVPITLTCLVLWAVGAFPKFWFWTFTYAREYTSIMTMKDGLSLIGLQLRDIAFCAFWLFLCSGVGLMALYCNNRAREHSVFIGGLLVSSTLAWATGFYVRNHYLVLMLPVVALLIGIAVSATRDTISIYVRSSTWYAVPAILFMLAISVSLYHQRSFLFTMTPTQACNSMYGPSPFPASLDIAKYIEAHTSKNEKIIIMGSEPQIYFYSHRLSGTGYIYMYGMMENHKYAESMQREMVREVTISKPKYLIVVFDNSSWARSVKSNKLIFEWGQKYAEKYYDVDGIVKITPASTRFVWGSQAAKCRPGGERQICVFRRKDNV